MASIVPIMKTLYQAFPDRKGGYPDYGANPKIYLEEIEISEAHHFTQGFAKVDPDELEPDEDYTLASEEEGSRNAAEYYFYQNDDVVQKSYGEDVKLSKGEALFRSLEGQEYFLYWSVSLSEEINQLRSDVEEIKAMLSSEKSS